MTVRDALLFLSRQGYCMASNGQCCTTLSDVLEEMREIGPQVVIEFWRTEVKLWEVRRDGRPGTDPLWTVRKSN